MKLLSLHIDKYKNLTGDYDFTTQDGYIALIGENGSGKSNLLEAISLIFGKLYRISNIEDIRKFRIRYEIDGTEYSYGNIDEDGNDIELEANPKLPSSIISCYSGEDMRLWHMVYENYYMQYFKKALRDRTFSPKIMYINKYCWKIAFIALLCSDKEEVKSFLKDCCHYNDITEISIKFAVDPAKRAMFVDHLACRWYDTISQNVDENGEINANIFASTDMTTYGATNQYAPNYVFQFLYLLSLPKKDTAKKQTVDKLINDITINVNGVNFDGLSEGEKKMILIECITQILGDKNSLVLLDEPDAHSHIARKKDLLKAIEDFEGQTILTTHSPVFVNEMYRRNRNNLCYIKYGKLKDSNIINKIVELSDGEPNFINSSLIVGAKKIMVVEGISDIKSIKRAIDVFSMRDKKYSKLLDIKFISSGGTGDVKEIFTEILQSQMEHTEQIVYLFDVDDAGKKGGTKIKNMLDEPEYKQYGSKIKILYYKENTANNFELEDLFPEEVYRDIVLNLRKLKTYRDFKTISGSTSSKIKDYIKENVSSFEDRIFDNFKDLLDRLMLAFEFN